ncbi:MAG: hypothetical protein GQ535_01830 [Rhodobacteraceae bacterium]|nr:hypothetical protein [Paracoccaceae bacterium]
MIYLLRHCDKTAEAAEAPLSNTGFKQAKAIAPTLATLGIKHIISSPYLRAQQSALPFAHAAGIRMETSDALAEWRLAGEMRADWKAVLAHGLANPSVAAKGGESANDVWARAQAVLQPTEPRLLVTHGGWLTVVLGRFGRPRSLERLLAIKSPDLFSISSERWQAHEL